MSKRNPFLEGPGGVGSKPEPALEGASPYGELARMKSEIDRERAELNRQITEARNERYGLEERAEQDWERLDERARQTLREEHRVFGEQIRECVEQKDELRNAEARLDELVSDARTVQRLTEREQDYQIWRHAREELEVRLVERESERTEAREAREHDSNTTLPEAGELTRQARAAMAREREDDREAEL